VSRHATTLPTPVMTAGQSARRAHALAERHREHGDHKAHEADRHGQAVPEQRIVPRRVVIPGRPGADQRDAREGDDPGGAGWQHGVAQGTAQAEQARGEEYEVREDVRGVGQGAERPGVGERVVGGILRQGRRGPRGNAGRHDQPQQDGARQALAVAAL
jgi:hypothetical protein